MLRLSAFTAASTNSTCNHNLLLSLIINSILKVMQIPVMLAPRNSNGLTQDTSSILFSCIKYSNQEQSYQRRCNRNNRVSTTTQSWHLPQSTMPSTLYTAHPSVFLPHKENIKFISIHSTCLNQFLA